MADPSIPDFESCLLKADLLFFMVILEAVHKKPHINSSLLGLPWWHREGVHTEVIVVK